MKLLSFFSFYFFAPIWAACNIGPCQVQYYQQPVAVHPPTQIYQQPQPQPQLQLQYATVTPPTTQVQYYYPGAYLNAYPVAPKTTVLTTQVDKDVNVLPAKMTYDDFEKELDKLQKSTTTTIIKTEEDPFTNDTNIGDLKASLAILNETTPTPSTQKTITYIREGPMPLPYRPVLPTQTQTQQQFVIPQGCLPVAQQYLRQYYIPQQTYVTAPQPQPRPQLSITPPPINDCCGKCGAACKYRTKKSSVMALASKIFDAAQWMPRRDEDSEDEPKDPKCNSEKLRDIMMRHITRTVSLSKRLIQKNAESELGGLFSVFCSTDDFSYVARSDTFCQLQKNEILCYAFKHQ
ncbi:unnamed protein product [Caenorhabditis angaria]|uniref:Ground-like domain-containing protein n=1 Tax=Caenorhabditis angaria TaxID=860376 RepID=A0A9P1IYG5_9PELO|nr:unnamed protein product [Caenorhabditis angaria]